MGKRKIRGMMNGSEDGMNVERGWKEKEGEGRYDGYGGEDVEGFVKKEV